MFKVGDKIRRIKDPTTWAPLGYEATVLEGNYYMGHGDKYPTKIYTPQWGLINEIELAKSLLEKSGYTITPPPEPLKGKMVIYLSKDRTIWGVPEHRYNEWSPTVKEGHVIVAIVDWTEGQGI